MADVGRALVLLGVVLVVVGGLLWLGGAAGGRIPFLGRLPGDIHVQRGQLVLLLPADHLDPGERGAHPDPGVVLPPVRSPRTTPARRGVPGGPVLAALAFALGCVGGAAGRRPRSRRCGSRSPTGSSTWRFGAADLLTVRDAASGAVLQSLPGPRILRVVPAGAGLDLVGVRRVDARALRFEVRRGPLRVGPRDYVGPLEIWRRAPGSS